jgi:hypothetical protein
MTNNKKSKSSRGKYKNQSQPDFDPLGEKPPDDSPPKLEELRQRLKSIDGSAPEVPGVSPIATEHHNDPPYYFGMNQVTPSTIAAESVANSAATSTEHSFKTSVSSVSESKFLPNRADEVLKGADDTNGSLLGSPDRTSTIQEGKDQSPTTREAIEFMT